MENFTFNDASSFPWHKITKFEENDSMTISLFKITFSRLKWNIKVDELDDPAAATADAKYAGSSFTAMRCVQYILGGLFIFRCFCWSHLLL